MNLSGYRGDTLVYNLNITKNGQSLNITGADLIFTVRNYYGETGNGLIQKTTSNTGIIITGPTTGGAQLIINTGDTYSLASKGYVYDIQMNLSNVVSTVSRGNFDLYYDVTR